MIRVAGAEKRSWLCPDLTLAQVGACNRRDRVLERRETSASSNYCSTSRCFSRLLSPIPYALTNKRAQVLFLFSEHGVAGNGTAAERRRIFERTGRKRQRLGRRARAEERSEKTNMTLFSVVKHDARRCRSVLLFCCRTLLVCSYIRAACRFYFLRFSNYQLCCKQLQTARLLQKAALLAPICAALLRILKMGPNPAWGST